MATLFEQWQQLADMQRTPQDNQLFWGDYFGAETRNYEKILDDVSVRYKGVFSDLAKTFDMTDVYFMGFLEGINTSLKTALDLESMTEETEVDLDIDLDKLYFNMLEAKADWLYGLPQWDSVLTDERRKEITREWRASKQAVAEKKVGRNDPCPCGSGKKYKHCCAIAGA